MLLTVARIGRAHGVLGEVTIEVRTDEPDERFYIGSVLTTEPASFGPLKIKSVRNHNGTLLLAFENVTDRNQAEKLRDVLLQADVDIDAPGIDEDDFHIQQLLGCQVFTTEGIEVGPVTDLVPLPGQDLLAINYQGRELLIPFVHELVPTVDLKNKRIEIVAQEGLLTDE